MQKAKVASNQTNGAGARAPPALDLERPGLTQPFKDFVGKGWITKVTFVMEPGSTMVKVTVGDHVKRGENINRVDIAPGVAKQMIIEAGLWTPGQRGNKQGGAKKPEELPKRSLCKRDFEGNDEKLRARIASVAEEIGAEKARGRVGSLRLMVPGVDTFALWWTNASDASKIRLLADKKSIDQLDPADTARLSRVQRECPFPGAVPTPAEEEENQEQQEEEENEEPVRAQLPRRPRQSQN